MKLGSDCYKCHLCGAGGISGGCLAGNGDDDFFPATKEDLIERLDDFDYLDYPEKRNEIIEKLKSEFNHVYNESTQEPFTLCTKCWKNDNFHEGLGCGERLNNNDIRRMRSLKTLKYYLTNNHYPCQKQLIKNYITEHYPDVNVDEIYIQQNFSISSDKSLIENAKKLMNEMRSEK